MYIIMIPNILLWYRSIKMDDNDEISNACNLWLDDDDDDDMIAYWIGRISPIWIIKFVAIAHVQHITAPKKIADAIHVVGVVVVDDSDCACDSSGCIRSLLDMDYGRK